MLPTSLWRRTSTCQDTPGRDQTVGNKPAPGGHLVHVRHLWECWGDETEVRKCVSHERMGKGGGRRKRRKDKIICQVRSARGEMFIASLGILLWFFPPKPAGPKGFLVFLEINANKLEAVSETSTWNRSDTLVSCTRKKIMSWMSEKLQLPHHQYSK